MKKGDMPKNFEYAWWQSHKPSKGVTEDPKFKSRMEFLRVHHIAYPKYDHNSKDVKIMYDRVNMLRQMVAGLKETKVAIDNMLKTCTDDPTKVALVGYLELMRAAERDRQNWIKIERGLGNQANLKTLLEDPGLDDLIRI